MAVSLYDVTVPSFEQTLAAIEGVLEKGLAFCSQQSVEPAELVGWRLYDDMLPLHFQIVSVSHHSLGALRGVQAGSSAPPPQLELDYAGLQGLLAEARAGLAEFTPEVVNGFEGKDVVFRIGDAAMPFIAEDFLLSFSKPNFYFHATTAYDLLRMKGVALGKRDFLGGIRLKS